ncbi:hypothetical protein SAMN05444166_0111 [Singulisphaera sp. GP187]|nr:hypothetical protein SAMN05444166_0111 [Singulisphaera sp. GP187]
MRNSFEFRRPHWSIPEGKGQRQSELRPRFLPRTTPNPPDDLTQGIGQRPGFPNQKPYLCTNIF